MEKHRMTIGYATQVFTSAAEAMAERFGLHLTWIEAARIVEDIENVEPPIPGLKLKRNLAGKKNAGWLEDDRFYALHEWSCVVYGRKGEDDDALKAFERYVIEEYDWLGVPVVHGLEIILDPCSSPQQPKHGYVFEIIFYAEIPEDGGYVWLL